MSFASVTDMINRNDRRDLCNLVSDTEFAVEAVNLPTNIKLQVALDDASGMIVAALLKGQRYEVADLEGLTGYSLSLLLRMNCDIAMLLLLERRPDRDPDRVERQQEISESHLKRLSTGEEVFDLIAQEEAGRSELTGISAVGVDTLHMIRDRCTPHYYPNRRFPWPPCHFDF
jgi:phage gp36-like protein